MTAARDQLAALLISLWEEDAGESLDGLDGVSEAIDAYLARLMPVVDRIANQRAAAELHKAADEMARHGWFSVVISLRTRAYALAPEAHGDPS